MTLQWLPYDFDLAPPVKYAVDHLVAALSTDHE